LTCLVCHEETGAMETDYCSVHLRALKNLKQAFDAWTVGYGSYSVPDFLQRIQKLPSSGQRVRQVAQFLLENPSRWN